MKKQDPVIFREVQHFRQIWLWVFILLVAAYTWYITIQQIIFGIPMGDKPAPNLLLVIFWVIFGLIFPIFMLGLCKLVTEVRSDGLYIRFLPFHIHYKSFLFKDIIRYEAITYSPLKRFGGWGIRFNLKGETAYNMSGKQGVELLLKNTIVVVGTQNSNQLIKALDSVKESK